MGLSGDVPPVPNGTMVWDGHLGSNPSGWYNGIIPGCSTLYQMVQWYGMDTWDSTPLVGTMGLSRDVPPVPNGTMVRDGHLGFNPPGWYNGIIPGCPTCTKWYNGTGWTLGIQPPWLVQWDYPGMSHLHQMVQWYGMDTWDSTPLVSTMGLSRDVPPAPNGTMVRYGHLGLNPSGWYNGIILGCPTRTKWYNGTGWTLGIEPLWLVQWDYPGMSHPYQMVQWYGMDTWD